MKITVLLMLCFATTLCACEKAFFTPTSALKEQSPEALLQSGGWKLKKETFFDAFTDVVVSDEAITPCIADNTLYFRSNNMMNILVGTILCHSTDKDSSVGYEFKSADKTLTFYGGTYKVLLLEKNKMILSKLEAGFPIGTYNVVSEYVNVQ